MTAWQPSSAGVTERRAIKFRVSSRVWDIQRRCNGVKGRGSRVTARVYTASARTHQAVCASLWIGNFAWAQSLERCKKVSTVTSQQYEFATLARNGQTLG